ncbi:hypothetical protein O5626_28530, partial [Escherichia coli]|nr:hypothetical protein [Escherichia coli]
MKSLRLMLCAMPLWMKDKTGMLQHRIEIAAFDCWCKYPQGLPSQSHNGRQQKQSYAQLEDIYGEKAAATLF